MTPREPKEHPDYVVGIDGTSRPNPDLRFRDPHTGRPVKRTPLTHRCSYDHYIVWQHPKMSREEAVKPSDDPALLGSAYSDRLFQENPRRFNELCQKHFEDTRQDWKHQPPEHTEAFLREHTGDPELVLTMVIGCCNKSSGHPLTAFIWKRSKPV